MLRLESITSLSETGCKYLKIFFFLKKNWPILVIFFNLW